MRQGTTFIKGEGCAGKAWQRGGTVIERAFQDGHEWKDNYPGQAKKYKSMISVPVRRGCGLDADTIIGVITVDTQIPAYFGEKDDHDKEDEASAMMMPYGTYIAFVCALEKGLASIKGDTRSGQSEIPLLQNNTAGQTLAEIPKNAASPDRAVAGTSAKIDP